MADFKNLKDLYAHLEKRKNQIIKNDIFQEVRETEKQYIEANVYDVYDPTIYERRGDVEGLSDESNIIIEELGGETFAFKNITKANDYDVDLAPIIQDGYEGNEEYFDAKSVPGKPAYSQPRLFEEPTAQDMKDFVPRILKEKFNGR